MNFTGTALVAVIGAVLGAVIGSAGARDNIAVDCNTVGAFRHGDTVYQCGPRRPPTVTPSAPVEEAPAPVRRPRVTT